MKTLKGGGGELLLKCSWSLDQDDHHAHIRYNHSRTKNPMDLGLGMYHKDRRPTKIRKYHNHKPQTNPKFAQIMIMC